MPPKKATPRQYATVEDAAEMLACSTKTIRRMISKGEITGYRIGSSKLLRVDLLEVDALAVPVPTF